MIDTPWAGRPVRIRWRKRRWICREPLCDVATVVEQNPEVCAARGLLSTRAIRWASGQLRREGATIQGLARQLGTTWNTLWSQVRPVLIEAANDPSHFEGVQVLGVDDSPARCAGQGMAFVRVPEEKSVKNRLHIDLAPHTSQDRDEEIARLLQLGAAHTDVGQTEADGWTVLRDPEGNEFCVLSSRDS